MQIGRTEGSSGDLAGLRVLQVPSDTGDKFAIAEYEADLLVRTIQTAITDGQSIPRSQKDLDRGGTSAATAGDFLIITPHEGAAQRLCPEIAGVGYPVPSHRWNVPERSR